MGQSLALLGLRNSPLLPQIKLDYQRCIGKTRTLKKGALNNSYTAGDEVSRCTTIKNWERDRDRGLGGTRGGPGGAGRKVSSDQSDQWIGRLTGIILTG